MENILIILFLQPMGTGLLPVGPATTTTERSENIYVIHKIFHQLIQRSEISFSTNNDLIKRAECFFCNDMLDIF